LNIKNHHQLCESFSCGTKALQRIAFWSPVLNQAAGLLSYQDKMFQQDKMCKVDKILQFKEKYGPFISAE
jgi:hypothetical protein